MIEHKIGSLLKVERGIIVHGVNGQGVMGSGVAAQIRNKYPRVYNEYHKCYEYALSLGHKSLPIGENIYYHQLQEDLPLLTIGKMLHYSCHHDDDNLLIIVNAITQEFYGRDPNVVYADYNAIKKCFNHLNDYMDNLDLTTTVNFPLIGCGLANGDWSIVSEIIDSTISDRHEKILWTI